MNNTQRKKIKMLVSYKEGYYKPPYPYTLRVRGIISYTQPTKQGYKVHAGCGVCIGYGYTNTQSWNETETCVCITDHHGIYSKKAYRFI